MTTMTTTWPGARTIRSGLAAVASIAWAGAAAGCGGAPRSEECLPGDFEALALEDGGSGFLRCNRDGSAYVPFDGPNPNDLPDVTPPDTGAADAPPATATCSAAGGAKLGFMCPGCATDADCQAGLVCFDFPNKTGNICTRKCTPAEQSTLCPPPSAACGNSGYCKP
jgi:hypothetical protein